MTRYSPLWMQKAAPELDDIEHSARQDRQILAALFAEGILDVDADHFLVRERALGPTFDVEIDAGKAFIVGDDETDQGTYLIWGDDVDTVAIPPAPVADSRIDLVVLEVVDAQVVGGVDSIWQPRVIEGVADAAPEVPATPASAIPIASVLVAHDTVSITDAAISDLRSPAAPAEYTVTSRFEILTEAERDALPAPYAGQVIFNVDAARVEVFDGAAWGPVGAASLDDLSDVDLTGAADGDVLVRDGGVWVPGDGSTDWEVIGEEVLASTAASVSFASIPSTYRNLHLVIDAKADVAAAGPHIFGVRLNNDITANYDWERLRASNTAAATETFAATYVPLVVPGNADIGSGVSEVLIPNYAGATFPKGMHARSMGKGNSHATGNMFHDSLSGWWRSTAAVNRVDLVMISAGSFIAGSTFTLYGLKGA